MVKDDFTDEDSTVLQNLDNCHST